ncbi:MAG: class I SAM-dependent methyltransferase [Planctomycetota bacterium]
MKAVARRSLYRLPVLGTVVRKARISWIKRTQPFRDSGSYWEDRYKQGGLSGDGSYGRLAEFKANFLNRFVTEQNIKTVAEFGCGDGNQLKLATYPKYVGLDVSATAIKLCAESFAHDDSKTFVNLGAELASDTTSAIRAELVLSLDVIYHLVEDAVFHQYMESLFDTAERFVVIYSSNKEQPGQLPHVRHRKFTDWIRRHQSRWELVDEIPNIYPEDVRAEGATSHADFYVYGKATQ